MDFNAVEEMELPDSMRACFNRFARKWEKQGREIAAFDILSKEVKFFLFKSFLKNESIRPSVGPSVRKSVTPLRRLRGASNAEWPCFLGLHVSEIPTGRDKRVTYELVDRPRGAPPKAYRKNYEKYSNSLGWKTKEQVFGTIGEVNTNGEGELLTS